MWASKEVLAIFVAECASRGLAVEDPRIDIGEPGEIAGGSFTDTTGARHPAPIWPRVMAAYAATKVWARATPAPLDLAVLLGSAKRP